MWRIYSNPDPHREARFEEEYQPKHVRGVDYIIKVDTLSKDEQPHPAFTIL
jgi:hypothetical protein